jgi:hypothetical protein
MKSLRHISILLLVFTAISVPRAIADGVKSVVVTNNTTYVMTEFYASPTANSDWDTSNNLLAGQSVGAGQVTTINITDGLEHCHYDLMAVLYGEAEHAYQYDVNTCHGGTWTVSQ